MKKKQLELSLGLFWCWDWRSASERLSPIVHSNMPELRKLPKWIRGASLKSQQAQRHQVRSRRLKSRRLRSHNHTSRPLTKGPKVSILQAFSNQQFSQKVGGHPPGFKCQADIKRHAQAQFEESSGKAKSLTQIYW